MKRMKRWAAALLALAMAAGLAGCGGEKAPSSGAQQTDAALDGAGGASGRWVQQEALTVEGMFPYAVCQREGGLIDAWMCETAPDANVFHRYTAADGVNFEENDPSWLAALPEGTSSLTLLGNGDALATQLTMRGETDVTAAYYYCAEGGQPQPVDPGIPEGQVLLGLDPIGPSSVVVSYSPPMEGVTRAYYTGNSAEAQGFIYDLAAGQKGAEVDFSYARQSGYSSNGSPLPGSVNTGEGLLYVVDGASGGALYEMGPDGSSTALLEGADWLDSYPCASADKDGNYYQVNTEGITRLARGGSLAEGVVEDTSFAYAQPSLYPYKLLAAEDGSFYLCAIETSNSAGVTVPLYRYVFDSSLPAQQADVLTVWSLQRSETVAAAVAAFAGQEPEISVQYVVASEAQPDLSVEDILSTLVTELLAGSGPDVILCDGFDWQPYARQGVFADLSQAVDRAALKENLIGSYFTQEGAFVVPARWTLPVIFGLPEDVAGLTTLQAVRDAVLASPAPPSGDALQQEEAYAWKEAAEQPAMIFTSVENLTDFLLESSLPAMVTADGAQTQALEEAYAFIQAVGQHCQLPAQDAAGGGAASTGAGGQPFIVDDNGYFRAIVGNVRFGWADVISPGMLSDSLAAPAGDILSGPNPGKTAVSAVVRPGLCQGAFTPRCLMAVNASSGQQDAAKAFVATMLSEEVQSQTLSDGMPVRAESLQAAVDAAAADGEWMECFAGDVQGILDSARTPVTVDETVRTVILAHAQDLVAGSETVEQAVAATQEDLALYLAERQ